MTHIHDNHGIKSESCWENAEEMCHCDEHDNPFQANINFDEMARIIAGTPYELPLVLEVSKGDREIKKFLRESLCAGLKITEMIEKNRVGKNNCSNM